VGLLVNGHRLAPCAPAPGWQRCTWHVPASLVRSGGNLLMVETPSVGVAPDAAVTGDDRRIGIALRQIRISRASSEPVS
jgi:hypothetical protein